MYVQPHSLSSLRGYLGNVGAINNEVGPTIGDVVEAFLNKIFDSKVAGKSIKSLSEAAVGPTAYSILAGVLERRIRREITSAADFEGKTDRQLNEFSDLLVYAGADQLWEWNIFGQYPEEGEGIDDFTWDPYAHEGSPPVEALVDVLQGRAYNFLIQSLEEVGILEPPETEEERAERLRQIFEETIQQYLDGSMAEVDNLIATQPDADLIHLQNQLRAWMFENYPRERIVYSEPQFWMYYGQVNQYLTQRYEEVPFVPGVIVAVPDIEAAIGLPIEELVVAPAPEKPLPMVPLAIGAGILWALL